MNTVKATQLEKPQSSASPVKRLFMLGYDCGFKDGSLAGYNLAVNDMQSENKPLAMRKIMGEFYEFDARMIDGRIVYGFVYRNANTGWNDVFVEFDEAQKAEADKLTTEMDLVREKQVGFLKTIVSA